MALSKVRPFGSGFLIFQRLRAGADPAGALMEIPVDLRLHARLDRRRRGRPDASAGRATGRAARRFPGLIVLRPADANEVVEAWRVIMQLQHQPACPGLEPPGPADARPHAVTRRRAASARGAYVLADAGRRQARGDPDRHRQRGCALRRGLREARRPKASRRGSSACRPGNCSSSRTTAIARRCCRRR